MLAVRWLEIPDDERGGLRWVRLRAWILVVSADYPAAQSLLPFVESCGAYVFCRACDIDSAVSSAFRPFSFMKRCPCPDHGGAGQKRGRNPELRERLWSTLKAKLAELTTASATKKKKEFTANGLNKLVFAFDPKYIPHVHPTRIAPQAL